MRRKDVEEIPASEIAYYDSWTENELRNAIWDGNSGRHWKGPHCSIEALRIQLRRRGLSDRGYHEKEEE